MPAGLMLYLHLVFAFVFVGAVLSAHWNALAARRTSDWARRAALLEANASVTTTFGLAALGLLGVLGNAAAVELDYRMATDAWLRWVNGSWVVLVLMAAVFDLSAARALARIARAGAAGEATTGYDAALRRWRLSNGLLLLGFLAFLGLMVFRWRS